MTNNEIPSKSKHSAPKNAHMFLGLRWHHNGISAEEFEPLHVGDRPPNSYERDDGEPTDEELVGSCAICVEKMLRSKYCDCCLQDHTTEGAIGLCLSTFVFPVNRSCSAHHTFRVGVEIGLKIS